MGPLVMRFINQLFTPVLGRPWTNQELHAVYQPALEQVDLPDAERKQLQEHVAFQLIGDRVRHCLPGEILPSGFDARAAGFERGADLALDHLATEIAPALASATGPLDAIVTTTATGNLMPGLSYRMAQRLGERVRPDALLIDLANVGCTGSIQALNLVRSLAASFRQVLLVVVEAPSTLIDLAATTHDGWQGNCTFGDGAAALWITDDPDAGPLALAIDEIHPRQFASTGLDLIRWGYHGYYTFALRDHRAFDGEVRRLVQETLTAVRPLWQDEALWAIHPAGIALLVRLAKPLGLASEALRPTMAHYRQRSNMSSVGILHILHEVAATAAVGAAVNLLTMGAGFTVIYGRVRRVR